MDIAIEGQSYNIKFFDHKLIYDLLRCVDINNKQIAIAILLFTSFVFSVIGQEQIKKVERQFVG